ncbi:hypothetical protein [Legionella quateirensis]|uniref:Uncharacterized protein n=1 Tax=Legionella quateirensis TaxID=45072 RepID=A0A378KW51_9GAMM|nr:hypothetical protein [Legionella quateirensis]KTD46456.1 hypothetical protein Lqua_2559 [Legionella quateirensis]STY18763.1 Uncharacterised protein [Legionella quateirensis]
MMQRVLLVLLCFCSFLATAGDTVLKLYRPFGEVVEQVAPVIKSKLTGACFTQSRLILREDAWRCQAEGKIYDPCFVKAGSKQMEALCPQSPWEGDSVLIQVSAPLNNENHSTLDMSRAFPWGIELANGEHCQAIEPSEVYDAMPIRYRCSNHNVLIGYLQRCKTVWSMLEKTPQGVVTVEFTRAWF